MPVKFPSVAELLFAQQNAAPVAQLSGPDAELMSAVDLRQRLHAGQQRFAAPDALLLRREPAVVQLQFTRQRLAMIKQARISERSGIQRGIKSA